MKDKVIIIILGVGLFVSAAVLGQACNREVKNPAHKENAKNINHGTEVYEVEFDGQKYIVVQTYKGIGVCKK